MQKYKLITNNPYKCLIMFPHYITVVAEFSRFIAKTEVIT